MVSQMSISTVNNLNGDDFERMFGNVVELCSDAAIQVWKKRPFSDVFDLCEAFHKHLMGLSHEGKTYKE